MKAFPQHLSIVLWAIIFDENISLLTAEPHSRLLRHHHGHSIICVCRHPGLTGATALSPVGMDPAWYDLGQSWPSTVRVVSPLKGHLPAPPALSLFLPHWLQHPPIDKLQENEQQRTTFGSSFVSNAWCKHSAASAQELQSKEFLEREDVCNSWKLPHRSTFWCCKPKCGDRGSEPRAQASPQGSPLAVAAATHEKWARPDKNPHLIRNPTVSGTHFPLNSRSAYSESRGNFQTRCGDATARKSLHPRYPMWLSGDF